jgi:hypothetical protein
MRLCRSIELGCQIHFTCQCATMLLPVVLYLGAKILGLIDFLFRWWDLLLCPPLNSPNFKMWERYQTSNTPLPALFFVSLTSNWPQKIYHGGNVRASL